MTASRWIGTVALAAVGLSLAGPGPACAQRIQTIARVIATSDVDGRFARPVCERGITLEPADQVAFTYALSRAARESDHPLVVDMGGLLTPHGVARYAADHRPSSIAVMVSALGYRALALGVNDLAAPRPGMLSVISELRERGIPMIASNLRCGEGAEELCALIVDASDGPSTHVVNGRRTAVLSVLRPNATSAVAPDRARGIVIENPVEAIARLTRIARGQGAELVVAVVDAGITGGAVTLATELPPDARPDLLLVSGNDEILFARPTTMIPVLVGAPPNDAVEVRIRESSELREGYEMLAQPLGGRGVTVGEPVLAWIDRIGHDYCEAWGRPLAGAHLDDSIDFEAMMALIASVMRDYAGADVAVLNRQALDSRWRAAHEDALTASDVYIAIEYDEPIQTAEVDDRWLVALARKAQESGSLVTPGLTWTGTGGSTAVKVDGHATQSRGRYSVATIRFLAAGGDTVLPALTHGAEWVGLADQNATLRTVVLRYLERARTEDPRRTVSDPAQTLEWLFTANADLTFSGSSVANPRRQCVPETPPAMCVDGFVVDDAGNRGAAYGTTQLSQADLLIFGLQVDVAANAAAPDWTWQNTGNVLYRTAWTEPTRPGQGAFVEAADQVRARSTLSWRGLRDGRDIWYMPDPTVDLFIESELTEPADRDWHWFLTRPTAGLRFQLLDKLQLQINGGFQVQPFDPERRVEPGVGATLTLAPWEMIEMDDAAARLAFTFDYFVADLGDQNRGALRGTLDASFDLAGPLALVLRANLLLQHERGQDVGTAISATAGIRLGTLGRAVGP